MKFSLVYPTRHRPKFIETALAFLERETYNDFEVIVSDNYTDPALSCEAYCRNSSLRNIKYVRPPSPLGMVANWNHALQYATGDYVCYFTDKMFLLPGTLSYAAAILQEHPAEILNWAGSSFSPLKYPDYFGLGVYVKGTSGIATAKYFEKFDPKGELRKKVFAAISRGEQDPSHYARGKICFGAYDRKLIARILDRTGQLFYNVSPDYTSMILGLSYANSAVEINQPGIVHINTDLSNGGQGAIRDEHALSFLTSLDHHDQLFEEMLVPNLYSCVHNVVAHDYIALQRKLDLDYELNRVNWLVYIAEDLDLPGRLWSSPQIELEHRRLLANFVAEQLNDMERQQYFSKLKSRASVARRNKVGSMVRNTLRSVIPEFILELRRKYWTSEQRAYQPPEPIYLHDLLDSHER